MPFYPTADRDDGYDITDFYGVDARLGSHGDVVELIRTARDRGMRVIADLVVNHTSAKHPWFRAARQSTDNPFRDFYVWRSEKPPPTEDKVIFPDEEDSIWELDEKTGEYYLHRFYTHQPDLNIANLQVRDEIAKVMGFWMELGLSGFRVDAVPLLLEGTDTDPDSPAGDPHDYLRSLRSFLGRRRADDALRLHRHAAALPADGPCRRLPAGRRSAGASSHPLRRSMGHVRAQPRRADPGQAVRRRTSGGVQGVRPRARNAAVRARSTASAATYGGWRRPPNPDELLVAVQPARHPGAVLRRRDRDGGEPGHPGADGGPHADAVAPRRLPGRVQQGAFGPQHVNAADQRTDPNSLLAFISLLARRYRECPELGWCDVDVLDQPVSRVLAHRSAWDDATLISLHNLSEEPVTVPLELGPPGRTPLPPNGAIELTLEAYGYRWLRQAPPDNRRLP